MSRVNYLDQDTRDENEQARRDGIPVHVIAQRRGMNPETLCELMSWPQWKEIPKEPETDLFALDRLEDVL